MAVFDTAFWNVRLVAPEDADYIAFMRRMADKRPSRGGPRAAGEVLGGLVERCVRHWLEGFVPLQEERILAWEQRQRNGRHGTLYRELDAVWQIDDESLCLYEMKLTYPENMENGVGLRQLEAATETLFAAGRYRYILKRLVYVGEEKVTVLEGLLELAPDDEYEEFGVIWVSPAAVEAAAQELDISLPADWLNPNRAREPSKTRNEMPEAVRRISAPELETENADNPLRMRFAALSTETPDTQTPEELRI